MALRPVIFVSAVTKELKSARQLVANTLTFLGYEPVWQEIFGTEGGDLRGVLREKIDRSNGVVQLLGQCYGTELPAPDEKYGRVSYTQYEALYARSRGKKVWYLFIGDDFPTDPCDPEPEELRQLQAAYRQGLESDTHIFHRLTTNEALESSVLKLRDDLTRLRSGVKRWAIGVMTILLILSAATFWMVQVQHRQTTEIAKQGEQVTAMQQALVRLADVEAQARQPGAKQTPEERRVAAYETLEKELGLPPGALAKELPIFALELYNRPGTTLLMRARAAYALGKFDEAAKLSLEGAIQDRQAYETANRVQEERRRHAIEEFVLAGQSAQNLVKYDQAMEYFREAEKFTDQQRTPEDWAGVQSWIGDLQILQGQYRDAERTYQSVIQVRTRALGVEHPDTLRSRMRFARALVKIGNYVEAEREFRDVITKEEKVFGPEGADTILSKQNLAVALYGQAKYAEAETLNREVIRIREKILGPKHPDTFGTRGNLANTLDVQGKYAEAEAEYREVTKLEAKVLGPEHRDTLRDRQNLANTLDAQGKFAEAEALYREVIKLYEKVLGPEHPDTLMPRSNLASSLIEQGRYAEAEAECRDVVRVRERVLGPEHPSTLIARHNLAASICALGRYDEGESQYREVIKLEEKVLGSEHPETLEACFDFATALKNEGKDREASEFARRAAEGSRKTLGPEHPLTKKCEGLVGELDTKS